MTRKYRLTIDEAQADAIVAALDLYSRLASGQYERLADFVLDSPAKEPAQGWSEWHRDNDIRIKLLKELHFQLPLNASYSIFSEMVPLQARMCYDVQQVIRKQLATDRNTSKHHFDHNAFMSTSGHEFVAKISESGDPLSPEPAPASSLPAPGRPTELDRSQ